MKIEQIETLIRDEKIALEERFIKACVLVDKLRKPLGTSESDELVFYGYFKQGTLGACKTTKPSMVYLAKCYKWEAWNEQKDLTQQEAQEAYIEFGLKALTSADARKKPNVLKICAELTEEILQKLAIEKLTRSDKKSLCVIDQAKAASLSEEVKFWSALADRMKNAAGVTATAGSAPASQVSVGAGVAGAGAGAASSSKSGVSNVIPITFSSKGSAAATAAGTKASVSSAEKPVSVMDGERKVSQKS